MKLKLITNVFTLCSKPENCVNVCSIHFHHVHSLLVGGRSSFSEPHSCTWLDSVSAPPSVYHPRQPPSLPKWSAGTDQVMLF